MKGRQKTVEQHRQEGSYRGDRHAPPVTISPPGQELAEMAEPPEFLPAVAAAWWRIVVPHLHEANMLDVVDLSLLEMAAVAYDQWRKAQRVLRVDGHFQAGSHGQMKEHTALRISRESHSLYLKTVAEFGLSPMSRGRLGIALMLGRTMAQDIDDAIGAQGDVVADADVVDDQWALPPGLDLDGVGAD
jgi:P27 family predicted phage terminase small subunit